MGRSKGWVDVVIPTYNRSALCRAAVESVLSQTYPHVCAIVVDDGSEDDTADVIPGLDKRVHYIRQANAGVVAARNRGLQAAQGEYVALLDSDDLWLPWKLEAQLDVLAAFPEAGMVWTDMAAVDESGAVLQDSYLHTMYGAYEYFDADEHFQENRLLGEVWADCPAEWTQRRCYAGDVFKWMFMGSLVQTSTVLMRRERQQQVGLFNTDLVKSGEDYEFHLRTCRAGPVAYLDASSIHYRVGAADQLTADKYMLWMARNNMKTVQAVLSEDRDRLTLPDSMIRERVADANLWCGMTEFWHNGPRSRRYLRKSLAWRPYVHKALGYYVLSFLPTNWLSALRRLRHAAL
jgi:glycosyltransferase involved in cell wall biosynthesis